MPGLRSRDPYGRTCRRPCKIAMVGRIPIFLYGVRKDVRRVAQDMVVLGIETTCDETGAAVVERRQDGSGAILSNIVLSQAKDHAAFGGVVPEIAARAHVEVLDQIISAALAEAGHTLETIDAVAAAAGPG